MGMDKYVLQTNSLSKSFGKTEILHGIDMSIEYGVFGAVGTQSFKPDGCFS